MQGSVKLGNWGWGQGEWTLLLLFICQQAMRICDLDCSELVGRSDLHFIHKQMQDFAEAVECHGYQGLTIWKLS